MLLCILILFTLNAVSGPPQNFVISTTSHTLTLSWSPPLPSQRNGVITSYLVFCTIGGVTTSNRISGTSQVVAIDPFTSYTCTVSAATMVGDGPPATVSGTSDENGEYIIHYNYCDTSLSSLMCCTVPTSSSVLVVGSSNHTEWTPTIHQCSITAHTSVEGHYRNTGASLCMVKVHSVWLWSVSPSQCGWTLAHHQNTGAGTQWSLHLD